MQFIKHPQIQALLTKFSQAEILKKQGILQLALRDPDHYRIITTPELGVELRKHIINPGIYYLDDQLFPTEYKLENFDMDLSSKSGQSRDVIRKLITNGLTTYIAGANGTGKTTFVVACCNEAYEKRQIRYLYLPWNDIASKLSGFKDNKMMIEKIKKAPYVIFDDFGAENVNRYLRDNVLIPIINYRLEQGLTTIYISNYEPKELLDRYCIDQSDSKSVRTLFSKLLANCRITHMVGENYRNNSGVLA